MPSVCDIIERYKGEIFMTERDLMRFFEEFDGEVSMSDFTPDELEEMLGFELSDKDEIKRKYFSYYNDVKNPTLRKQDW